MEDQIFDAASHGKLHLIKNVLEHRPSSERVQLLSSKTAGATPLIAACRNGHYDVAEYLIKSCGADVELVGSVVFDGETIEGVPPLWCAAAAGHLTIVNLLVQNKANVNSTTKTLSSPLRAACFDGHFEIVQYLVQHGADIELANTHGHSCLMIACYKNHLRIATYLIEQGANINRKSVKANTALHDCAEAGALNIMKLLLLKGARFESDSYGMSPLFAAAVAGHANIVEYVIGLPNLVSSKDKIDALELLGATFVDNKKEMLSAHRYWKRALDCRHRKGKLVYPKPRKHAEVYDGRCEVDTYAELADLISDPDEMRMQSLMVRERILGPAHPDTAYYIRYRGAVYADAGQFDRCITLWMYALNMQQQMLSALSPLTQGSLLSFAELFWFMVGDKRNMLFPRPVLKFKDAFEVFKKAVTEVERSQFHLERLPEQNRDMASFHRLLVITLQLIAVLASAVKTEVENFEFHKTAYRVLKLKPRGTQGWTFLHIICSQNATLGKFTLKNFPTQQTVEFLVNVGADVNARDLDGNTPLLIAVESKPNCSELIQILLNAGAHLDETNCRKECFDDILKRTGTSLIPKIDRMPFTSLKCLAARVIISHNIAYRGNIPVGLENFLQVH